MNAAEFAILKDIVDKELPALIVAEEAKLPAAYAPIVGAVVASIMPELMKILDAKLDSIKPSA